MASVRTNPAGSTPARFVAPMLCQPAQQLPEGREWTYELKLDGYRAVGVKSAGRARLWSRNEKDFTVRFSAIARALENLPDETVIDGEVVALDENGLPTFNLLQDSDKRSQIVFYAFDLLHVAGIDIRREPLGTRRELLRNLLIAVYDPVVDPIRYSETFEAPPTQLMQLVKERGIEGIVAKRRASVYQAGKRSDDWVKVRANRTEEFVIGGYVPTARSIDAILVGQYKGKRLLYVGFIRAGFTPGSKRELLAALQGLSAEQCPFPNLPDKTRGRWREGMTADRMRLCRWVKPRLVANIEFLEWTPEKRLRHPRFAGLSKKTS